MIFLEELMNILNRKQLHKKSMGKKVDNFSQVKI